MKKKIITALVAGVMVAAMAMPVGVFADNTTEVGVVPNSVRPDPDDARVIVTIPADCWFANAAVGETINKFNLQLKVLKGNTYVDLSTDNRYPDSFLGGVDAFAKSSNNWNLKNGDTTIEYMYYRGSEGPDSGSAVTSLPQGGPDGDSDETYGIGNMHVWDGGESGCIEGYLKITNVDNLTAADAGKEFKDTITFTFDIPER